MYFDICLLIIIKIQFAPKWPQYSLTYFLNCVSSQHVHIANMLQMLGVRSWMGPWIFEVHVRRHSESSLVTWEPPPQPQSPLTIASQLQHPPPALTGPAGKLAVGLRLKGLLVTAYVHYLIKNLCKSRTFNQFGPILCVLTQLAPTRRFNLFHFVEFYLFYLIRVPYWPTYLVLARIEDASTLSSMLWFLIVWNRSHRLEGKIDL